MAGEWRDGALGDLIELKRGYDLPQKNRLPGNVPVLSSSGATGHHSEAKVPGPGVVTGRYGTLGEVFYVAEDFWPLNTTLYVRDFKGNDSKFVSYFLRTINFFAYSDKVAVPGLNRNHLHQASVRYPEDLAEQRAIARILGALDDKIELNRRMNETLEEMAQAIFKSWFVDFDPVRAKAEGRRPERMDEETAELFPDSFEDSHLRETPTGWRPGMVQDICNKIENGSTPKRMQSSYWGGDIPWFKTGELSDGPLIHSNEHITREGLDNSSCKLWPRNTVLIALYASPTVGRLGILEQPATSNQACSGLIAKVEYGTFFLFYSLLFTRNELQRIAVGAAQQNISQKVVREHKIILPEANVAQRFGEMIDPVHKTIVSNLKQSRTLAELRDALLPRLLSGEIRVPEAEREVEEAL